MNRLLTILTTCCNMKKIKFYAYAGAIALLSTVGFTACSSEDDVAEVNPTFDGTGVRTDFAFSIAGGPMSGTRMGAAVVQQSGNFNGMKDMYLLPFINEPAGNKNTDYANSTTDGNTYNYPLGELTGITATASSKVYSLQIPVGTTDFLFYGTSNPSVTATTTLPVAAQKGSLTSSLSKGIQNTDAINFHLNSIQTTLGDDATALTNYLNYIIAQAKSGDIDWWETPTQALEDGSYSVLANLYKKFTTINSARAGSAEAVLRSVFDLYVTADRTVKLTNASTTDVYKIADAICTAITTGPTSGIKVDITIPSGKEDSPSDWTCAWNGLTNTTFPHNLYLPMGAAQLTYTESSHTFSYKISPNYVSPNPEGVALSNICYPAELIYFDNSPLRATNTYKKVSDYPVTVTAWDAAFADPTTGDWRGQRVEPTTRAVAMQNNVNYGVAMLKATVTAEDGDADTDNGIQMFDNQQALAGGTADKTIAADFKVTGILIGGQPKFVGWDMTNPSLPTETDNPKGKLVFDNVIYDQHIPFTDAIGTSASNPIYTLVLDNYTTAASQNTVRFALELKNDSGEDFYGLDGLIPAGHTFYLCGEMNPNATTGVTNKVNSGREGTDYRITEEDTQRVFMQDYQTTATITIKKDAIKKAYSTIPDLRATEVLFGLSVDLEWETGMGFEVVLE